MSIGNRPVSTHPRGTIFTVNLEPVVGSEQGGDRRPCVSVSKEEMSAGSTLIVVPFTKREEKFEGNPAYIVRVPRNQSGLDYDSVLLANQVRVVSKERLLKRIGPLSPQSMDKLEGALRYVQDLE